MDFDLSDEQRAFGHSVSRFLQERYPFEHRRRSLRAAPDDTTWQGLSELGVPMLLLPASAGGVDGGASDLLSVCEAFGGALVLQPLLSSSVMATVALSSAIQAPEVHALLERMATGEARVGWAHGEGHLGGALATRARRSPDGQWRLDGHKVDVLYGMGADAFVVSALEDSDTGRTGLFLVDAALQAVQRSALTLVDDTPAADIALQDCPALRLDVDATATIERAALWGAFASCAERVGVMDAALRISRDYLGQRKQFGQALSTYQSLRHHIAEMAADVEICRALAIGAAVALDVLSRDGGDAAWQEARLRIGQANLVTGSAAQRACEAAVQLHGGIGMTEEHPVGSLLRRVVCLNALFGQGRALARELALPTANR
ncbi:acyl-CoA dehydrogenase family protein [Hydrogenophaga palleronii]|uniref:acyl-CoA dehydrogenase family protein n=1 Tax=Hydrogenophaga palleronii TaxID=65655 RepID=UPI00082553EA|nr:acyl-CoA dehydrogenase [Hydrogenophaga palleronii]